MKKKMMMLGLCCMFGVSGCHTFNPVDTYDPSAATVSSIQSGEKGEDGFVQLDVQGLVEKMKAEEDFVVMISSSTCSHCNNMKLLLYPYLDNYPDIPFYEIEVDQLGSKKADQNAFVEELGDLVDFSGGTPEFFHIQNKEVRDTKSGEMSKAEWHSFMKACGYIGEEEPIKQMALAESAYLSLETFSNIAKKIENGNDFYLLCVEEDSYGINLSNTLKAYLEEQKQNVFVLNFTNPKSEMDQEKMQTSYERVVAAVSLSMTPTLFHIKDGGTIDRISDNVSAEELQTWFEKQNKTKE